MRRGNRPHLPLLQRLGTAASSKSAPQQKRATARHSSNWPPVEKRRQFQCFLGLHPTGGQLRQLAACPKFRGKSRGFSPGQVDLAICGQPLATWQKLERIRPVDLAKEHAGAIMYIVTQTLRPGVRESATRGTALISGDGGPGKSRVTPHALHNHVQGVPPARPARHWVEQPFLRTP